MYDLIILKKYNISPSFDEIYAGIAYNLLAINSINEYAVDLVVNEWLPPKLDELLWEMNNKAETLILLKKLLNPQDIRTNLFSIKKKLRYAILREIKNKEQKLSKEEILT